MSVENVLENICVDRDSYIPIYIQLRDFIKGTIDDKTLKPGVKIPSENELTSRLNISRMTVRQAVRELESEGYVKVKKGEGTFVEHVSKTQMLIKLDGFSKEMEKLGLKVHSDVLEVTIINSNKNYESVYDGLGVSPTESIVMVKRRRYLENKPLALETSYLNYQIGKGLLEEKFSDIFSIYQYIEKNLKINLSRAEHIIEPGLADANIVELLKVKAGTPVLYMKGTTYSDKNVPVEYLEGTYIGDKYKLKIEITK